MKKFLQEYRLVADENGQAYVINADEIAIFCHWLDAKKGHRHYPSHFKPIPVDPMNLVFTNWREEK